jgi:hypothetical protein
MAITRRQFIKRTGLATAGTVLGPGLFSNMFVRHASPSRTATSSCSSSTAGTTG